MSLQSRFEVWQGAGISYCCWQTATSEDLRWQMLCRRTLSPLLGRWGQEKHLACKKFCTNSCERFFFRGHILTWSNVYYNCFFLSFNWPIFMELLQVRLDSPREYVFCCSAIYTISILSVHWYEVFISMWQWKLLPIRLIRRIHLSLSAPKQMVFGQ